jgi:hypothetical protein
MIFTSPAFILFMFKEPCNIQNYSTRLWSCFCESTQPWMLYMYKKHSKLLTGLSNLLFIIHSFYCCESFVERSCSNLQDGQSLDCTCPNLWSNLKCCYCAPLNWNIIRWNCKILLHHSIGVPKHARKALVQNVWNSVANVLTFLYLMQQQMKYVFCVFSYCCTMLQNCWHKFCIFQRSFMVLVEYTKWRFIWEVYMTVVWCCGLNSWKLHDL